MITDIAFLGLAVDTRQLKEGGVALGHFTGMAEKAEAETRQFETAVGQLNQKLRSAGQAMKSAGADMSTYVTLPLVGAGVASLKMASSFETAFTRIETLVGLSTEQVAAFRDQVLALSGETGRGPQELADALFVITSAGIRGQEAMEVLSASAKSAALGLGNTADIGRALTGVMQSYASSGLTAAKATDQLIAIVREGNLEASSLAGVLGRVVSIASVAGVSFGEVGANIATFTRLGVSAEEATTGLRGVLTAVIRPTEQQANALKAAGLSADYLRSTIRDKGLAQGLVDLTNRFKGNEEGLARIIPEIQALASVLGTAGVQSEQYVQIADSIINANGLLEAGFARTGDTVEFKFQQALANLKATGIEIGAELFPVLEDLIRHVRDAAKWFAGLDDGTKSAIVTFGLFAAAAGPVLSVLGNMALILPHVIKMIGGLGPMTINPWVVLAATLAGGAVALGNYAIKSREAEARNRELVASVDDLTESFKKNDAARPQLTTREMKTDMQRELGEVSGLVETATRQLTERFEQVRRVGATSAKSVREWAESFRASLATRPDSQLEGFLQLIDRQASLKEDIRITNDLIEAEAKLRQARAIHDRTRSGFTREQLKLAEDRVTVLKTDLGLIRETTAAVATQATTVRASNSNWKQYESIVDSILDSTAELSKNQWADKLGMDQMPMSIAQTNEALREMTMRFEQATDPATRERIQALIDALEELRDGMTETGTTARLSFEQLRAEFAAGNASMAMMDETVRELNRSLELTTDPEKAKEIRNQITEINKMRQAFTGVSQSAQAFGQLTSSAFEEAILSGKRLGDVIRGLARDIAQLILRQSITNPLADFLTGAISGLGGGAPKPTGGGVTVPYAKGGVFSNSVVNSPTLFPMGLMGEAGPEAIVPLKRGADGRLGVTGGKTVVNVSVNNQSGSEVRVTERANGSGGADITFEVIDKAIAQSIERGGAAGRAITRTFGLGRQTINRG